jgi:hypothetical protein
MTNNEKQIIFLNIFFAEEELRKSKELYETESTDSTFRWYRSLVEVKSFAKGLIKNLKLEDEYFDWTQNGKTFPIKPKY